LGSSANTYDYVATECRLNETITVGQAVRSLFAQQRENRLPPIPMGGATSDPEVQATWKAFDRWVHHQGPRPVWANATLPPVSPGQAAMSIPIEEKAVIDSTIRGKQEVIDELAVLVKANTYRCDSISAVRAWLFSRGFTLVCNRFSYEYEIADKGGHWIVTVK